MRNGDTARLILDYTIDGEPITEGSLAEIEMYVGDERFTLTGGDIVWDNIEGKYVIDLTQAQTFSLSTASRYQLRVKKDGQVGASPISILNIGETISRKVL